jgi:hypothetical protein
MLLMRVLLLALPRLLLASEQQDGCGHDVDIFLPRPFAQLCVDELFMPVNVSATSAFLFIDGAFISRVSGPCMMIHIPLDGLVCGAHNLELIPVDRNGSVCYQPPGMQASSIVFFDLLNCASGRPPVLGSRGPAYSLMELAPRDIFSTMQCAGVDGYDFRTVGTGMAVSGTCWMQDACYEPEIESFVFFAESGSEPWQFGEHDDYRLPILSSKPSPANLGVVPFRTVKRVGPLALAGEAVPYVDAKSSLLYSPLAPWAWGLFVAENLWAVFMMQHIFGMASSTTQIVLAADCQGLLETYVDLKWSSPMRVSRCSRLLRSMHMAVSTRPAIILGRDDPLRGPSRICFKNLFVGSGGFKFRDEPISAAASRLQYRNFMWGALGREMTSRPVAQHVVINVKNGRRKLLNLRQLVVSLHDAFGDMSWISLNDATSVSFTREVALLQSATVLIAQNGAISAGLIFLPDRAAAIVSDIFDVGKQRSRRQDEDGHMYSALGHIRVLYYMIKPEEIPDHANYHWPRAELPCNITRMLRLVQIGLGHTSRALRLDIRGPRPTHSIPLQQESRYLDGASLDESHISPIQSLFFGQLDPIGHY